MKKRFGKLSKTEQEKVELEYHQTSPADFEKGMSRAKKHVPDLIRLPHEMVETLKAVAKSQGERGYQTMVRKWIEERLHQRAKN